MLRSLPTRLYLSALCAAALLAACGAPPAPASGDGQVLTGSERFGWDQPATDRSELASFRYAMYVDGTRTEVADVTCSSNASASGFACTCRLPALSSGAHTLQVAAFVLDGATVRESSRSAPVRVTMR
jgi:hypothetical protein